MAGPRLTVITATYNWSTVPRFSISIVLAQTVREFELTTAGL